VYKQYGSNLFGTSFSSLLVSMDINTALICGNSTSGCIKATTMDAIQNGLSNYVFREACGDGHESVNDFELFDMDQTFAEVRSEEWTSGFLDDGFRK
jgi:maleamate amidohydrolase